MTTNPNLTIQEIRMAQAKILETMQNKELTKAEISLLELSSLHLRTLERTLMSGIEQEMVTSLKLETHELQLLVKQMNDATDQLFKVAEHLSSVLKITGQLIKILTFIG